MTFFLKDMSLPDLTKSLIDENFQTYLLIFNIFMMIIIIIIVDLIRLNKKSHKKNIIILYP
jgi:hypothetical protein